LSDFPIKITFQGVCALLRPSASSFEGREHSMVDFIRGNPVQLMIKGLQNIDSNEKYPSSRKSTESDLDILIQSFNSTFNVRTIQGGWELQARRRGSSDPSKWVLGLLALPAALFVSFFVFLWWIVVAILIIYGRNLAVAETTVNIFFLMSILCLLVSYLTFLAFGCCFWGRDFFKITDSSIFYSFRLFGKSFFNQKIPKTAIEDIEVTNNQVNILLFGGDSIKLWKGPAQERRLALKAIQILLTS
jgi:hypothetical protein